MHLIAKNVFVHMLKHFPLLSGKKIRTILNEAFLNNIRYLARLLAKMNVDWKFFSLHFSSLDKLFSDINLINFLMRKNIYINDKENIHKKYPFYNRFMGK